MQRPDGSHSRTVACVCSAVVISVISLLSITIVYVQVGVCVCVCVCMCVCVCVHVNPPDEHSFTYLDKISFFAIKLSTREHSATLFRLSDRYERYEKSTVRLINQNMQYVTELVNNIHYVAICCAHHTGELTTYW